MAIPVTLADTPEFGSPEALFDAKISDIGRAGTNYDVSADGQRFLALKPVTESQLAPMTVVLNWTSLLEK